jgi:large subunit ribosomal protein L13
MQLEKMLCHSPGAHFNYINLGANEWFRTFPFRLLPLKLLGGKTMKTFMASPATIERKWYVVDATGMTLGRLSSEIAKVLRGKNKPIFTPHMDCGDYVIVVNAEKVAVTGRKLDQKIYYRHSEYVGGMKETTLKEMLAKHPERVIEHAVKGMLPKGPLGRDMYRKLFVYAGPDHKHAAQKPEALTF